MNKSEENSLMGLLEKMVENLRGTVDNQKDFLSILNGIIRFIDFLIKSTVFIYFILILVVWRVFLWDPLNLLFSKVSENWTPLPGVYKSFILGFIGTVIGGVIAHIVGSLLLEKIKKILK